MPVTDPVSGQGPLAVLLGCMLLGCGEPACGPVRAKVAHVIDGDTIVLESGERVRYLSIDAPEISGGREDCYGREAASFNRLLVEQREVELRYDVECADRYDRTLAYVLVDGREVNSLLVERGYACALNIPPSGAARAEQFQALQQQAESAGRGLWGACSARCR